MLPQHYVVSSKEPQETCNTVSCLLLLTAYVFELITVKNTNGTRPIVVTALSHERSSLCYEAYASSFSSENIIKCISAYKCSAKHACLFPSNRRVKLACSPITLHSHRETPDEYFYTFLSHFQTLTTSYNMWVATVLAFSNFQLQTWTRTHNTWYTSCISVCSRLCTKAHARYHHYLNKQHIRAFSTFLAKTYGFS